MIDVITGNWDLRNNLKQEIEKWSKYVEEREKEKRKEGGQKEKKKNRTGEKEEEEVGGREREKRIIPLGYTYW